MDPTRPDTLETVIKLHELAESAVGSCPFLVLLNKSDIESDWKIDPARFKELEERGWLLRKTSAKLDENVEESFHELASLVLQASK